MPKPTTDKATKDERVDYIIKLMLRGTWKGGASREVLGAEWGCHERTVGDYADIASGVLARRGRPIEEFADAKLQELESIQRAALDHVKVITVSDGSENGSHVEKVPDPNYREAIAAIKLQLDIRGVTSRAAVAKPTGKAEPDADYEKLSAEQRIAMHRAAIAEEETKLKGGMH